MGNNIDNIIAKIIVREGGDRETNDPLDKGGRTKFGISEAANPDLWKNGPPTLEMAVKRYKERYCAGFDQIQDASVAEFLIDWAVLSGRNAAIKGLQRAVGTKVDGMLGPHTIGETNRRVSGLVNKLVKERVLHVAAIVKADPSQVRFLKGWLNRALEFLE